MRERLFSIFIAVLLAFSLLSAVFIVTEPKGGNDSSVFRITGEPSPVISNLIRSTRGGSGVGIVDVMGPIYFEDSSQGFPPFQQSGSASIVDSIDNLILDDDVKAILLRINSPGGSIGAVEEIDQALQRAREYEIPLVASMADVAASGGYYVAASCDKIFANAGTLTGSIGVIFSVLNASELMGKIGVSEEVIKSGKFKDIGSYSRRMTDEEKKMLNETVNIVYEQFLAHVVNGRKAEEKNIRPWADGRIMSGSQALEIGLIDEIGDMEAAFKAACELAEINPENARRIYSNPLNVNVLSQLFNTMSSSIFGGIGSNLRLRGPRLLYMTPGWELY